MGQMDLKDRMDHMNKTAVGLFHQCDKHGMQHTTVFPLHVAWDGGAKAACTALSQGLCFIGRTNARRGAEQ